MNDAPSDANVCRNDLTYVALMSDGKVFVTEAMSLLLRVALPESQYLFRESIQTGKPRKYRTVAGKH